MSKKSLILLTELGVDMVLSKHAQIPIGVILTIIVRNQGFDDNANRQPGSDVSEVR